MTATIVDPLVKALRQRRKDLGLSQEEVGHRMGSAASMVNRLEHGGRTPGLGVLRRWTAALECNLGLEPLSPEATL